VALTTHHHLESRLKKEWSYTSTSLGAFVACCRGNFGFFVPFTLLLQLRRYRITNRKMPQRDELFQPEE